MSFEIIPTEEIPKPPQKRFSGKRRTTVVEAIRGGKTMSDRDIYLGCREWMKSGANIIRLKFKDVHGKTISEVIFR